MFSFSSPNFLLYFSFPHIRNTSQHTSNQPSVENLSTLDVRCVILCVNETLTFPFIRLLERLNYDPVQGSVTSEGATKPDDIKL